MQNIFEYVNNFEICAAVKSSLEYGDTNFISNPLVSILMPCYTNPDTFRIALDSAINQNYTDPYEIVVVDNWDKDSNSPNRLIVEQFASPKVLYYHNEKNLGMFGNWNRCIELARSPFVTFLHDDDVLNENCLSTLMSIQSNTLEKAIFSAFDIIDKEGVVIRPFSFSKRKWYGLLKARLQYDLSLFDEIFGCPGCGCGSLFYRQGLIDIGGYNPAYYPSSDYALDLVYTSKFGAVYNRICTFNYRVSSENASNRCYKLFPHRDKFLIKCVLGIMIYPRCIKNILIKNIYKEEVVACSNVWGKEHLPPFPKSICDKIFFRCIYLIRRLKTYKM